MEDNYSSTEATNSDDKPPILQSWSQLYIFVLIFHAFIIFLFYLFTHAYS